jgi:hypothetical protein
VPKTESPEGIITKIDLVLARLLKLEKTVVTKTDLQSTLNVLRSDFKTSTVVEPSSTISTPSQTSYSFMNMLSEAEFRNLPSQRVSTLPKHVDVPSAVPSGGLPAPPMSAGNSVRDRSERSWNSIVGPPGPGQLGGHAKTTTMRTKPPENRRYDNRSRSSNRANQTIIGTKVKDSLVSWTGVDQTV